jgi:hypothetical protein
MYKYLKYKKKYLELIGAAAIGRAPSGNPLARTPSERTSKTAIQVKSADIEAAIQACLDQKLSSEGRDGVEKYSIQAKQSKGKDETIINIYYQELRGGNWTRPSNISHVTFHKGRTITGPKGKPIKKRAIHYVEDDNSGATYNLIINSSDEYEFENTPTNRKLTAQPWNKEITDCIAAVLNHFKAEIERHPNAPPPPPKPLPAIAEDEEEEGEVEDDDDTVVLPDN